MEAKRTPLTGVAGHRRTIGNTRAEQDLAGHRSGGLAETTIKSAIEDLCTSGRTTLQIGQGMRK